jgi:hypothetical protein
LNKLNCEEKRNFKSSDIATVSSVLRLLLPLLLRPASFSTFSTASLFLLTTGVAGLVNENKINIKQAKFPF